MDAREQLARLSQGFMHSAVLLTACGTGVFEKIGRGAGSTAAALAAALNLDERALEIVLLALAADGLLMRSPADPPSFAIPPEFQDLLLSDGSQSQMSILNHYGHLMRRWVCLDQTLRTGRPAQSPSAERSASELRDFICGMANISRSSSLEAARILPLAEYRRMLDVGGGPATASITFCRQNAALQAVVFDLPEVCAIAREEIETAELTGRVTTAAGDFMVDDLPTGFDFVYVSNIIHSLSPDQTRALVRKCRQALTAGGTLVIKEFFLDDSRVSPAFAALFSVNMLVNTEGGQSYSWNETEALLIEEGFGDFRREHVAMASGLLIARLPSSG